MDPVELEHVIGFSGDHANVVCCHPRDPRCVLVGMGRNVVLQNLDDDHDQKFLQGHDEAVSAVAVSANGTFVASGQEGSKRSAVPEAEIIVWDLAQQVDVYRLRGIRGGVRSVGFSSDEMFLAGSGMDGSLFIWDMQTGELLANMSTNNVTTSLKWDVPRPGDNPRRPEYLLYATVGHQVMSFRLRYSVASMQYQVQEEPFRLPAGLVREYMDCTLSPCGEMLMLCTSVGDVNVYQISSQVYRASFPLCSGGAQTIHSEGPFVFVGGGDGTIKRLVGQGADWRLDNEISVQGSVSSLTSSRDEHSITLVAGTTSGNVYTIDANTMAVVREIKSESQGLVAVAFKRGSSVDEVLAGFESGAVRAFDARKGGGRQVWEIAVAHRDGVSSLCSTHLFYATGGLRGGVRLWSRTSKSQLFEFSDHISRPVTGLLPDVKQAHLLHSCGADKCVFTYDLKKERRMVQHQWRDGGVLTALTQRLDSENELLTAGTDGCLLTWDCDVEHPVSQVQVHGQALGFSCVQVSPLTGHFVAASSTDARVRIWDLATGALVATTPGNGFVGISAISWSPDEKQIVAVGEDKCITVWNFYADAVLQTNEEKHK
ncbi:Cilia- and flagella-associated protein 52 [Durusdinium trenchii]|uniref:Cilia- and flagella-associated protein 52 n=1 Tax=Durusdinium trenchii TaxID=1381693 RepID=A0ABP0LLW6_9DINO